MSVHGIMMVMEPRGKKMSDKHEEYIKRLDKIERDLSWIIQYLLKKDQPFNPPPFNPPLEIYKTHCARCGMNFEGITSYLCSHSDCPIFTKNNALGE